MLQYVIGDVLNDSPDLKRKIIVQVVNDIGVMGSGVAKAIMDKYPIVHTEYTKWKKLEYCMIGKQQIPFKLGQIQVIPVEKYVYVINMIAQHQTIRENEKPIRYSALCKCMEKVAVVCNKIAVKSQS